MFDSTALLGVFRPFRLLTSDGQTRSFWLSRLSELLADWIFIIALLVMVFAITTDTSIVALFMLVRILPRAVVAAVLHERAERIGTNGLFLLSLPRILLAASLALVDSRSDLVWAGAVVAGYGFLTALSNESRATMMPRIVQRPRLAGAVQLNAAIERLTFVAGPLLTAFVLWVSTVEIAMLVSAIFLLGASTLLRAQSLRSLDTRKAIPGLDRRDDSESAWNTVRRQPTLLLLAGGLFAGAVLAITLNVLLVELVNDRLDRSDSMYGLLLAIVGIGTLLGPLSVPRLLGHLPVSMIVTGSTIGIASGLALISVITRLEIVVVVLTGIGLISITNDMVTATAIRRVSPDAALPGTSRLMVIAILSGQLVAAVAVAGLATVWDATEIMLIVGVTCGLAMAVLFTYVDGLSIMTRRFARS